MFNSMPDVHLAGAAPSSGVEEGKFEDSDEPSAEELRDYRLRFLSRQPLLTDAPKINSPLHHALHDAALNDSQLTEATERSLRDSTDGERSQASGEHAPDVIPPDDVLQVASTSSTTRSATSTAGSSMQTSSHQMFFTFVLSRAADAARYPTLVDSSKSPEICAVTRVCSPMSILTPPSVTPPIVHLFMFLRPLLQAVATVVQQWLFCTCRRTKHSTRLPCSGLRPSCHRHWARKAYPVLRQMPSN